MALTTIKFLFPSKIQKVNLLFFRSGLPISDLLLKIFDFRATK